MNSQSQIVEKVRKLLALSKSSNINEAATAASIANKYIVQYRLKEADYIEQHSQDAGRGREYFPDPIYDDAEPAYESARVTAWKMNLLCLIAHHYGCAVWNDKRVGASRGGRSVSRFRLVGRYNDVKFTKSLFSWLVTEIERHAEYECKGHGHVTAASYCKGAVKGIEELLYKTREQQRAMALQAGKSKALARVDSREKEAQDYMYRKHNLVQAPAPKPKFDPTAFERGFDVGGSIGRHIAPDSEK